MNPQGLTVVKLGGSLSTDPALPQWLDLLAQLTKEHPERSDYQMELAHTYANLGALLIMQRRHPEAKTAYQSYLKLAPKGEFAGEVRSILSSLR